MCALAKADQVLRPQHETVSSPEPLSKQGRKAVRSDAKGTQQSKTKNKGKAGVTKLGEKSK